jgi:hypothetical protein
MSPTKTLPQSTRPHPDTVADINAIITATRGTPEGQEHIRDTNLALSYLKDNEHKYLSAPFSNASYQTDSSSDSDDNDNSLTNDTVFYSAPTNGFTQSKAEEPFIYHGFWSGPFNWRVELFMKSYLYTQSLNPSHAQLWLWIDVSTNENALQDVHSHPLALQFAPLIKEGLISFVPWTLPKRISLPRGLDNSDGLGFLDNEERRKAYGYPDCEIIADSVMRDPSTGDEFLVVNAWAASTNPSLVSVSDIVRFVVLHLHGGVYLDIDMLLLKDFRPLLLSGVDFAERWGAYSGKGDFNTAVCAIKKMSSLSTFFLRQGVRLGLLFHPRIMGWHLLKAGRVDELAMLESAAFDQVWPEFAGARQGEIATPSWTNFTQIFEADFVDDKLGKKRPVDELYRGSWAYHMHNQWKVVPEKGSWMEAVMLAHDEFFAGRGVNGYGEVWEGTLLEGYENMPK